MPTLYILIVDEPGKEQWMKIFSYRKRRRFFSWLNSMSGICMPSVIATPWKASGLCNLSTI